MFELRNIPITYNGSYLMDIPAMCHECGLGVGLRIDPYQLELRPAWAVYHIESGNALPECFETQGIAMKFIDLVADRMLWWLPWRAVVNEPGLGYVLADESAKARHGYEAWVAKEVAR